MNNSVFGKTMKNMQDRVNIKIVRSDEREKIRKLIASPLFAGCTLLSNDLAGFKIHKEYAAKETMSWGLIETITAARAVIQQTLSTVKISRVRGSVISILNICKKWRWGVSGTRCHRKCNKKIVVYKKVAETIERSHRWPERRETFWFSVCKFARSMAKRTFCSSHRVIPNGNSARQAGIRGHRFFTDNDWEGEFKKE